MTGAGREPGGLGAALAAHDDRLSACVHCGFCLPACPTYTRLGDEADSPRGRLHLMRAVADGRLDPASVAFQRHIDCCLGCRACETVCPSGVEYGFLLERAREVAAKARPSWGAPELLLTMIRVRPVFLAWMWATRALRATGLPALLVRVTPAWPALRCVRLAAAMLAASSPWRPPASVTGPATVPQSQLSPAGPAPGPRPTGHHRGRVAVLLGCIQSQLFRRVNEATIRVLGANGWEVVGVKGQGCCGALHAHSGDLGRARELALNNISAFRAAGVEWIVANAAGCGATMKEYSHLFEGAGDPVDHEAASWFSGRVLDVSEILMSQGLPPVPGGSISLRVAYDPPCHLLHGQRVGSAPVALLSGIPGLDVRPVPKGEECCGGAGIYGVTHPDLGGEIGADKVRAVLATEADLLATGNPGCAMQIGAGLRLRGSKVQVAHPVELLDESYRRGGVYGGGARVGRG